jgi:ribonuclease P protein component
MLAEKNRLRKQKDFERISKNGQMFSKGFLVLKKLKNDLEHPRFGFVVSLKISKKAVIRNKIKRRLREAIRHNLEKIKEGQDIVFFTRKGIEERGFQEIQQDVECLLKQAGIV